MATVYSPDRDPICWTRMQAEAGEQLTRIMRRKELERRSGNGVFFWGVGSAPSRAIPALVRTAAAIDVLFSVMKSKVKVKVKDAAPAKVVAWRSYVDADGIIRPIPGHVLVTSRAGSRGYHYALICRSDTPLAKAPRPLLQVDGQALFDQLAQPAYHRCYHCRRSAQFNQPHAVARNRIAARLVRAGSPVRHRCLSARTVSTVSAAWARKIRTENWTKI